MRLALRSFAVSLLFCGFALAGDNVAPHLTAFSFSPNTVDTSTGSATVTVTATATDDLSGVASVEVGFLNGQVHRAGSQTFAAGMLLADASIGVVFPKYSGGYWTVEYVIVRDQVGNQTYLTTSALMAAGFPVSLTIMGTPDNTPPQLTAFSFSPTTIDTSASAVTVALSASATDSLSGVGSFQVVFLSPDGKVRHSATMLASGGTATGNVVFPKSSPAGIWTVESVSVRDQVDNVTSVSTAGLLSAGVPSRLIINGTGDSTPPHLTALSFSPSTIDTSTAGATVSLSISATDDLSGLATFQVVFLSPDGNVQRGDPQTFAVGQSTATGNVVFPKSSQSGRWIVQSVTLSDLVGNATILGNGALIAAGFPTQLTVGGATSSVTVTLGTSANPSSFGAGLALTATVSGSGITGRVTFFDGVEILGIKPIAAGVASLSTALLSAGPHKLTAYYRDDVTFVVGTSNVIAQTVRAVGGGYFAIAPVLSPGVASVAIGDFNGDGKIDFAIAEYQDVSVRLGRGDGTFQLPVQYPLAAAGTSIVTGDFNGDGKTDLATTSMYGYLNILLGNADGTFGAAATYAATIGSAQPVGSMLVGDFNSDGKADIAIPYEDNTGKRGVSILVGNGDGSFSTPFDYGTFGSPAAIADFNGDGIPDLALGIAQWGSNPAILLGFGDRTAQAPISVGLIVNPTSFVTGDFNGDGKADLAVGGYDPTTSTAATWVLLGNGDGTFLPAIRYGLGAALVSGDFNGDGFADLAVVSLTNYSYGPSNMVGILQGNGDGTFLELPSITAGVPLTVTDFNGDGRADIVTSDYYNGKLAILMGSSSVTFTMTATGGTPQSARINSSFSAPLQVTVLNNGFPMSGAYISFTAPTNGAGIYGPATAMTDSSGVASITPRANNVAGSYTVTASYQGVTATFSLTNTPGLPNNINPTGGTPQSAGLEQAFASALQATVTDQGGNPVSGVTVIFTPPASGASATLSAGTAVTNAAGIASVTATANNVAGNYGISASVVGCGCYAPSFYLTNLSSSPSTITALNPVSQSATMSTNFSSPLQALVKDAAGNPVSGVTVTFAAPSTGVSANLSNTTVVTDAYGIASVFATANNLPGNYSVTASVSAVGGAATATFSLTNLLATPASIAATGGISQSATISTAFASALQATVKDISGNPVSGAIVTFAPATSGASAALSATTAVTNASGVASVTATANNIAGAYTVTASVLANGTPVTATFWLTNTATAPASITATGAVPQSATVTTQFPNTLQATVKNAAGQAVSGVVVTFAAPTTGASANLSSTTAVTNSSGVASVTATANTLSGTYTIVASVQALTASFSLTNAAGQPANIAATGGTPQSAAVGSAFPNPLQATVKDSWGNPVNGVTVNFGVPASGAGAVLSSLTAVTDASGVASVTATANAVSGSYVVTAGVRSLSVSFSLTNASARISAVGGTPQSTAAGTAFSNALQALVKDAAGNPVSGTTVTFAAPATGASATLSSATAVTSASGVANVTATANATSGSYIVTATTGAFSTSFALTNTSGSPASITATGGTPQSAAVATVFPVALQATVKNAAGAAVSGATVTFAVPATGATATLSSATAVTNASGIASVTATASTTAGSYTVTATTGALSTSFALTNTTGPPASIAATAGTPQSAAVATVFSVALQATVKDAAGRLVIGTTVTFAAPTTGASATLSSASAVTNASGVASVTATANAASGTYTVVATSGGYTASFALTNTVGAAASIASTGGTPQTVTPGAAFPIALQATVKDSAGNPVSGVVVSFSAPTTGASAALSNATASTNASGTASVTATANSTAGSYSVTASAGTFSTTFLLANTVGVPATLTAVGGSSQATLVGTLFGNTLQASVRDSAGNPLSGVTVTFATPQSGPSAALSSATAVTNASGVAIVIATANTLPGNYSVTASVGGITTSFSLTNVAAGNLNLALGRSTAQSSTLAGTSGSASAVDGNTDGGFYNGSVTSTNSDPNAWWQVDLGASMPVGAIKIWNRTDCCSARLNDYWVLVSETPFGPSDLPSALIFRANTWGSRQTAAPNPSVTLMAGVQGRYVRVQLAGTGNLSLAEVQVFAGVRVTMSHAGSFLQGQPAAQYTILVTNGGNAVGAGTVSVSDTLPAGLTATAIGGPGWTCTLAPLSCLRSDALGAGASYPPITITVSVASNAPALVVNEVYLTGVLGTASANDSSPVQAAFTDVSTSDLFLPAIDLLKEHGITSACQELPLKYCPNDNITEAQMAVFVVRFVMGGDNFTYTPTPYFTDVPATDLYFPWIQKMQDLGIALPCTASQFCPNTPVTRAIMAGLIIRGRYRVATPSSYPATPYFTDVPANHPYFPWIQKMKQFGITTGCTPTTYCPNDPVTRGQMAVFIMRGGFNLLLPSDIPVISWVSPASTGVGQTVLVTIMGQNTNFNATTQVNAGAGITVTNITVTNGGTLTAQFGIAAGATLGPRSITVTTGSEEATLPNGFWIK